MQLYGGPALFALFVWWFSTGLVLVLDGLAPRTFKWSMVGATVLLAVALYGLAAGRDDTSIGGAYLAFTCGVLTWAWLEISFYTGFVTGPRRQPCADGCAGWSHFGHAIQASLWHELAILAAALLVVVCTWDGANQIGRWTFVIMWWMHQSAKLNVFLGVRNLNAEFLPPHLQYLRSFLTRRPMNLLFPVSVTLSTIVAAELFQRAAGDAATPFAAAGFTFLGVLMTLAILEHWFLMVPLPIAALWSWSLRSRPAVPATRIEVVTGFLGAGKTTFLRRRLASARPEERLVVLVNDFGEIGVDGSLLAGRGADVVELPNGCLCCSMRDDLARQLREIVSRYAPARVLIEPSGVAETGSLLRTLHRPDTADLIESVRVVALVDARAFLADYARMPDFFRAQAGASPVIVINKADLVTAAELQTVVDTIRPINPDARILTARYGAVDEDVFAAAGVSVPLAGPAEAEAEAGPTTDHAAPGLGLTSWSGGLDGCYDEERLRDHLAAMADGSHGRVVRAKGIARVRRGWVHFDLAAGRVTVAGLAASAVGRAVVIGHALDRLALETGFRGCRLEPRGDTVVRLAM
jgi:putative photosynthetic complex assembly protein 2